MCMQDVIIGRKTGSYQVTPTINATSTILLPADDKRFAIVISNPSAGVLTLSFADPAVANQGIRIDTGSEALILTLKEHGNMVTRKIMAIMSAGSIPVGVWVSRFED